MEGAGIEAQSVPGKFLAKKSVGRSLDFGVKWNFQFPLSDLICDFWRSPLRASAAFFKEELGTLGFIFPCSNMSSFSQSFGTAVARGEAG